MTDDEIVRQAREAAIGLGAAALATARLCDDSAFAALTPFLGGLDDMTLEQFQLCYRTLVVTLADAVTLFVGGHVAGFNQVLVDVAKGAGLNPVQVDPEETWGVVVAALRETWGEAPGRDDGAP